ncbi:MAG: hypothetical protein HY904_01845 [Deltaproteobacteria bacterium]|nr:hypothetical protein [Deltaproteobacteria bacterium]
MRRVSSLVSASLILAVLVVPGAARAERCIGESPVLMITQDRSNSMWADPSPSTCGTSCTSKWAIARTVVPDVVNQFSGDFRYGLVLYPGDRTSGSCTTGITYLDVGSSVLDIQAAYEDPAQGPAGATPTAATLRMVMARLQALNTMAPANVLLITDGVPNCNWSLDPATCPCTSSGQCYPGVATQGKYCLDDADSQAAAAELYAAGHKVFVIGFGADVTADHNAAVLNAIAQAGGTGAAYSAASEAALAAALQQVILAARDCCVDACTAGDASCAPSGQSRNVCTLGAEGCYVWTQQVCPGGALCSNGQCQACNTTCTAGATQCGPEGVLQTCVSDASGCTHWNNSTCPNGSLCNGGSCTSCTGACTLGDTQCVGNGTRTCGADSHGCTQWSGVSPCPSGTLCDASTGQCASCAGACVAGSRMCVDAFNARECVADATGCTSWNWNACPAAETCSGGSCGSCNSCTAGATRCAGNTVQVCTADGQGCTGWQDSTVCQEPQYCDTHTGSCTSCPVTCEVGTRECSGPDIRECVSGANGCNSWRNLAQCSAPQVCLNAACCTNECTLAATRCSASGAIERCEVQASGCSGWAVLRTCQAGTSCVDGDCVEECVLSGEGDSCPVGKECQPDSAYSVDGHCRPRPTADGGTGSTSSSSGGGGTSTSSSSGGGTTSSGGSGANGTSSGGGGAGAGSSGGQDDDVTVSNCGCEMSAPGGGPMAAAAALCLAGLALRRRRR